MEAHVGRGLRAPASLSICTNRLAAQTSTTGDVTGIVTDPSGSVVPGATVILKDETKGAMQEVKTSDQGTYRFYLLTPGAYSVSVTATGFQTTTRRAEVAVGQIAALPIQLTLGASTSSVTVTEAAPLLQTDNGDTSTTLSEQQISQVPNPGNDLTYIAGLAPGTVMNTTGGMGNVEAFGLPATSNLFTMNGMDDNDPFLNLNNSGASKLASWLERNSGSRRRHQRILRRIWFARRDQRELRDKIRRQRFPRQPGLLLDRSRDGRERLVQ